MKSKSIPKPIAVHPLLTRRRALRIAEIYEDMAKAAPIDGILFHDDATLSDFEDATPAALKAYKAAGLPASIKELRADPETLQAWTDFKTDALIAFTASLADQARHYRPSSSHRAQYLRARDPRPAKQRHGSRRITTSSSRPMITPRSRRCRALKKSPTATRTTG